ncbi:tRNA binding domain protein [Spraguea lophii 42_110]|uniref:tRNA binding domain protein n=1 Tax=Spraguea lophii (strain 42_110) TaxID=1358809 RepID=S7W7Z1_SPRLO|nr:tRNA binding domain protein [Spraguea lophii 42_110]
MKITYSHSHEDILFAIEYLNLPIEYVWGSNSIELKIEDKIVKGEKEVLREILEICKCDPHDLTLLNENIISDIIKIRSGDVRKYLQKLLEIKGKTNIVNEPSNIALNHYINGENITLADLVLFARVYKSIKEGINLGEKEIEWFNIFQTELKKKMDIEEISDLDFDILDIRVGTIKSVIDHPDADSLYVETVESYKELQIISGVKNMISKDDFIGKKCLFLVNLKPKKLRGIKSEGMILVAKGGEEAEIISAPDGCADGDKIIVEGGFKKVVKHFTAPQKVDSKKSKIYEEVMSNLKFKNGILIFKDKPLVCNGQYITSKIKEGIVS